MPPGKRNASGEPNSAPVKQPKTERPEEFSKQVRSKLQGSSRTGQACDRCKVCIAVDLNPKTPSPTTVVSVNTNYSSCPGPQDSMRWTSRRMLALPSKQYRMSNHGSHHWPSHSEGVRRGDRTAESRSIRKSSGIGKAIDANRD
jgi:hypothetical protein